MSVPPSQRHKGATRHQMLWLVYFLALVQLGELARAEVVPQELYDCLNEGQGLQRTVYEQFVEGFPTRCGTHP